MVVTAVIMLRSSLADLNMRNAETKGVESHGLADAFVTLSEAQKTGNLPGIAVKISITGMEWDLPVDLTDSYIASVVSFFRQVSG